jgi:leucyl aminopeptidase
MEVEKIRVTEAKSSDRLDWADGWMVIVAVHKKAKQLPDISTVPAAVHKHLSAFHQRSGEDCKAGYQFATDFNPQQRLSLCVMPEKRQAYWALKYFREAYTSLKTAHCKNIAIDVRGLNEDHMLAVNCAVSVIVAAHHRDPKYAKKTDKVSPKPKISIVCREDQLDACKEAANQAAHTTAQTNFVRYLTKQAGNDLDCKNYVALAQQTAKDLGLGWKKWDTSELKKLGAGAFLAVCQGSVHQDAAIVRLTYQAKAPAKGEAPPHIAVVGKGVVYDTGGVNIKPANYMHGMHSDMGGSAVALALVKLAAAQNWPISVSAYLAIAENNVGPDAYKPNDVVHTMLGKTIEVIHTDAEGRMMLSDTLTLASREKPKMILDFATLTGSCVRAIGDKYSGAFTNHPPYVDEIIAAGVASGERVWPFPLDEDFGEVLKSDIADIKQCRLSGGPDHIEAAWFLKQFIENDVPWVHIDLSSFDCEGGLAHVEDKYTGFGVRFGERLIKQLWRFN